ncbi:GNAT family N-acetyltransferase [Oxalobacteraceae sp. CFBP 13708]|nr:GNAT family N-acetyltransferase [Oxalobacteraceae sp. CFBP 13708]
MGPIRIRTLQPIDAEPLLKFELENRQWFERHIDARSSAFYSLEGVTEHIASYLAGLDNEIWHPLVIEDSEGKIVGRANLKDINVLERSAEVGYRIAESACGQGLATLAVRRLIQEARSHWNLSLLVANVHAGNLGSAKVLQRCGFSIKHVILQQEIKRNYQFVLLINDSSLYESAMSDLPCPA